MEENKKLFVGGLPWAINDDSLRELFSQVGEVEDAKVITDRDSGRSKGFGFVTMATPELAKEAVSKFDGYEVEGRTINVSEARPQEKRERSF